MSFDMSKLPEGWSWQLLEDVCDRISVGHVGETSAFFCDEGGVPLIRSQNVRAGFLDTSDIKFVTTEFHQKSKKSSLRAGDVLIVRVGQNRGDCAVVPEGMGELNCANIVLTSPKGRYSNYLGYYFNTPYGREALLSLSSGSAQLVLNTKAIAKLPVPYPPEETAVSIGEFGRNLDDRIDLLRQTNATLEAIAQALFKSWFVDFDPVHANAGTQAPSLPPEIQALFPATFTDSPQGPIPEGWEVLPFTDTINVIGGGTPKTAMPEYWDGDIPWFSVVDAPSINDVFVICTQKQISETGLKNCSSKLLPIGTTIISARGTVGRLALVGREMAMNQSCYGLRGKTGGDYFTYFTTYRMVETLKQRSHGSVFDTITRDTLTGVDVIYPAQSVIMAFEDAIGATMEKIKINLEQSQNLANLRDTLLPRLISGQLRLPEAEQTIAAITD